MSNDVPDLRASHEDRNRVAEVLSTAAGDGRLSAEELETRLESALSARTLGELAQLTADLPSSTLAAADDVRVIEQEGGKQVLEGRWQVPARIRLDAKLCKVTLDFSEAVITSSVLRIDAELAHGKLTIIAPPDIVIDTNGLTLTYSKLKLHSKSTPADHPRLRIELVGTLYFAKVIQRRP
jgi:Domain of unknown function (DUF1707)